MAQLSDHDAAPTPPMSPTKSSKFRRWFGRPQNGGDGTPTVSSEIPLEVESEPETSGKAGLFRRMGQKVVPGLPRAQTFKRQQSEQREHLAPVQPTAAEKRAISVDRRSRSRFARPKSQVRSDPRTSAPSVLSSSLPDGHFDDAPPVPRVPDMYLNLGAPSEDYGHYSTDYGSVVGSVSMDDTASTTDDYHSLPADERQRILADELERIWILNLSMHFRDRSKREKFFVTYRESEHLWRRVTVSLDYRDAPEDSLEYDLEHTPYQKDKNSKIYEAIRESLPEIQFYSTVTNLKLQTTDGRLHVHVVEDGNVGFQRIHERREMLIIYKGNHSLSTYLSSGTS